MDIDRDLCERLVVLMATRAELYKKFGPILLEAIVLIIRDEINILRGVAGLPERTNDQIMNAVDLKLNTLTLHDWMNDSI